MAPDNSSAGVEAAEAAESVVAPVAERVVNAPVEAVVAPIAVLLMPVAVVLKWFEVMVRSFAPVLMLEAPNPDSAKAPDVAVTFKAPVVTVNPFATVREPVKLAALEMVCELIAPLVAMVVTPDSAPAVVRFRPVDVMATVLEAPPMVTPALLVPVPTFTAKLELLFRETTPPETVSPAVELRRLEVESEVNAPVDGVVAPMAVPLIPVAVVLKLPVVKVRLLPPVLMEDAPRPDNDSVPDVAVRLRAPVVTVNPFATVSEPVKLAALEMVCELMVVTPVSAPTVRVAVPSVIDPPVIAPEALMVVAPAMAPALVMPPALLLMPPVTEIAPENTEVEETEKVPVTEVRPALETRSRSERAFQVVPVKPVEAV